MEVAGGVEEVEEGGLRVLYDGQINQCIFFLDGYVSEYMLDTLGISFVLWVCIFENTHIQCFSYSHSRKLTHAISSPYIGASLLY